MYLLCSMKSEVANFIKGLVSVKRYAEGFRVSTSYIYKLIRENRMDSIVIDGVHFIESAKYPDIPVQNRRK